MTHDPFAPRPRTPDLPPPAPLDGRRPRILAHVLRYFDWHRGGAERMLHSLLRGLADRGWDVEAVTVEHRGRRDYVHDGVHVQVLGDGQMAEPYAWCDVALTHLDVTSHAMAWARYGRPLLHVVHNHRQLLHHRVLDDGRNYPIWNSEWIRQEWAIWSGPSVVCRPPLHVTPAPRRPRADGPRRRVATLVNLLGEKGGPLFWRLARRLADWQFVGVEGAYGYQHHPDPMPPNGTIVANGLDLGDVWRRTGVMLVPSWYESWSLAGVEALAHGIPVIAHPTPGLVESMGDAAIFRDRDDDDAWVDALRSLEDPAAWWERSRAALDRARVLAATTADDLDALDAFARALAQAGQRTAHVPLR